MSVHIVVPWLDVRVEWHIVCCTVYTVGCEHAKHVKAAGLLCLSCALQDMHAMIAFTGLSALMSAWHDIQCCMLFAVCYVVSLLLI